MCGESIVVLAYCWRRYGLSPRDKQDKKSIVSLKRMED
jgi:hypothetical protein